jgi:hypothetical protein
MAHRGSPFGVFVTAPKFAPVRPAPRSAPPEPIGDCGDYVSILNFEDGSDAPIPEFTEPATLAAMHRLAITPSMLSKPMEKDLATYGDDQNSRRQAEALLNNRRRAFIEQVKAERERLLTRSTPTTRSTTASRESRSEDFEAQEREAVARIERLQQKEIESAIFIELKRERDQRKAEEMREIQAERQKRLAEEQQAKQQESVEKRRHKDELLLQRVAEKQAEMDEMRRRQDEIAARNQQMLEQRRVEEQRRVSDADKDRMQKAERQRQMIEAQRREERRKIAERLKIQEQREAYMQQRRTEQLDMLRERNAVKATQISERFATSQEKARKEFEEQRRQLARREMESQLRLEKLINERDLQSQRQHDRNAAQVTRHHAAAEELQRGRESRLAELAVRDADSEERRRLILEEKTEKQKATSAAHAAKTVKVAEQKDKQEQDRATRNEEAVEKWARDDQHTADAKARNQRQIENQAKLQKLRSDLQEENAARIATVRQMQLEEKQEESDERQRRAHEYVENQILLAWKKRDARTQLDFKKAAMLSEFREEMKRGGKIDLDELSRRFGVDIAEMRRRLEESDKPASIGTGIQVVDE